MPATKQKSKTKKSGYQMVAEYFRKDAKTGCRFGTLKTDKGDVLVLLSPVNRVEENGEIKTYSVTNKFGKPVNFNLNPKQTRKFKELLDQTIAAALARS